MNFISKMKNLKIIKTQLSEKAKAQKEETKGRRYNICLQKKKLNDESVIFIR